MMRLGFRQGLVAAAAAAGCLAAADAQVVISRLLKKVDLAAHPVSLEFVVDYVNHGRDASDSLFFSLPAETSVGAAYIAGTNGSFVPLTRAEPQSEPPLQELLHDAYLQKQTLIATEELIFFKIPDSSLAADEKKRYVVTVISTEKRVSKPWEVAIDEVHRLEYLDYPTVAQPYPIEAQHSSYRVGKGLLVETTGLRTVGGAAAEARGVVVHAENRSVEAFEARAAAPAAVRHQFNRPIPVFERAEREFYVFSPEEAVVKDRFWLRNDVAKLKGGFDRWMVDRATGMLFSEIRLASSNVPDHWVLKSVGCRVPKQSYAFQYFDEIGNVSTSTVSFERDATAVSLYPRFPLLGGWKTDWRLEYRLPLATFTRRLENGTFELRLPLAEDCSQIPYESLRVRFSLPKTASLEAVEAPRPAWLAAGPWPQVRESRAKLWGDVFAGRPVYEVDLGAFAVPAQHAWLVVRYRVVPLWSLLRRLTAYLEPLALAAAGVAAALALAHAAARVVSPGPGAAARAWPPPKCAFFAAQARALAAPPEALGAHAARAAAEMADAGVACAKALRKRAEKQAGSSGYRCEMRRSGASRSDDEIMRARLAFSRAADASFERLRGALFAARAAAEREGRQGAPARALERVGGAARKFADAAATLFDEACVRHFPAGKAGDAFDAALAELRAAAAAAADAGAAGGGGGGGGSARSAAAPATATS